MSDRDLPGRFARWLARRSWTDVLSYVLVVAGIFLGLDVHVGFLLLVALGAFGPGLLRELRVLDDRDELQRTATASAGHRAFLVGGLLLVLLVLAQGSGRTSRTPEQETLILVLLWMLVVYFFSYAFSFWDARRAGTRILVAFGLFWLLFVLLSHAGEPVSALLEGAVVPLPFFVAAWLGRRWPRVVGVLLVVGAVAALFAFDLVPTGTRDDSSLLTALVLPLPLAVTGLGLLGARRDEASP